MALFNDKLARERAVFNASLTAREDEVAGAGAAESRLDTIALMRDSISEIKGGLYKGASQSEATKFLAEIFKGTSKEAQLRSYADTLKANMLSIATDPSIKDFFGPQMSDADVRLMTATATRLNPDDMTPSQILSETTRIEEFIGKYEEAVRAKANGYTSSSNVVVAPDGRRIEIVPE